MSKNLLYSIPPENLGAEELATWLKNLCNATAEESREAEKYYRDMKNLHKNMSELMGLLSKAEKEGNSEEVHDIVDAVIETVEAIKSLREGQTHTMDNSKSIDEVSTDFGENQENKKDLEELEEEEERFLKNYNKIKEEKGLSTQADVAKLTGIDRRYISLIERGKHKPQFKTLKKLADGFGVSIDYFIK